MKTALFVAFAAVLPVLSAAPLVFDVISIKPTKPDNPALSMRIEPGGRAVVQGATLKLLIQWAFQIQEAQILGTSGWMNSERYDIEAKPADGARTTKEQAVTMFQALLAERFKLALLRESKEVPVYVLTVGKNGPKMQVSEEAGCQPPPAGRCGGLQVSPAGFISGKHVALNLLANNLSFVLGRTVLNKTGLEGAFDIKLEWAPEHPVSLRPGEPPALPDSNLPSIFTAVQEQLGLKLESQSGPVETLAVVHAEKPASN